MARTKQCQKCGKNRILSRYKTARSRVCTPCQRDTARASARKTHLADTYDITPQEYDKLLASQDHGCAICGYKAPYNLQVDHCHKTGLVRGLLCKTCNKRLLPAARDNVDRLTAAINYLNSPPAVKVIGERITPDMRGAEAI